MPSNSLIVYDKKGIVRFADPFFLSQYGIPNDRLVGKSVYRLLAPLSGSPPETIRQRLRNPKYLSKSGVIAVLRVKNAWSWYPYEEKGGLAFYFTFFDLGGGLTALLMKLQNNPVSKIMGLLSSDMMVTVDDRDRIQAVTGKFMMTVNQRSRNLHDKPLSRVFVKNCFDRARAVQKRSRDRLRRLAGKNRSPWKPAAAAMKSADRIRAFFKTPARIRNMPGNGGVQVDFKRAVVSLTACRPIDHNRYDIRIEARVTYEHEMAFAFFFNGLDLPFSSPYNDPNVYGYTLGIVRNLHGCYVRLKRWENIILMNTIPDIQPGTVLDFAAEKSGGVFVFSINGKKIAEHVDTNYRSYCLSHYPGIILSYLPCRVHGIRIWTRKADPAYEKCATRYFDLRFKNFPDQIYEAEFFERQSLGRKLFDVYLHRVTDLRRAQADTRRLLAQKTQALDLLNSELKIAARVLNRLLPREFPVIPGVKFRSYYQPTGHVGGDLFDVLPVDDSRFAVFMYDVSGHGVPAALISVMTRTLFQKHFNPDLTLVEQLELINRDLTKDISGTNFVTIFFGILDHKKRVLNYIGAGFMPPFLVHEKSLVLLNTRGIPLGMGRKISSQEYAVELPPDSRLLLFTDGLYEVINRRGEFYSWDKFMDFVTGRRDLPLDELVDRIIAEHRKHSNPREQRDDVSLLGIEIS